MPRNIVGPPVQGDDCFGRDGFIGQLEQRLEHSSVLVLAPRRWGKTSVLRLLRDRDESARHYFDLYRLERASDFIAEVAASTATPVDRVRRWVGTALGRSLDALQEIRIALQLLTRAILAEVRDTRTRVSPALVEHLYRDVLLSADNRAYLDDFRGRLDRSYLPAERDVGLIVLNALARDREGLDLETLRHEVVSRGADERLLERVLTLLQGDFYVSQDRDGRYRFLNRYLADWWQRFHA